VKSLFRSFAGGEITPELFARIELSKFQTGLAKCLNFEIRPHGPAVNRAGLQYVLDTAHGMTETSVLLPFIYSEEQAFILEFGHLYVRFHALGGTVLETPLTITNITKASVGVLSYTGADPANGDWMFLFDILGMVELNGRYVKVANVNAGANTFELHDLTDNPINTTSYGTYTGGGESGRVYQIASPYVEADLKNLVITQSSDVLTITHVGYQARELRRMGATNWQFNVVTVSPTQAAPTSIIITPNAAGSFSYTYTVTAIAADGREESLKATPVTNALCQDLGIAGAFNTVTWTDAAGAIRYNIYKKSNGIFGYIGQADSGSTGFKDSNVTPDMSQTPPETDDPISAANDYPGAVGYFQGRRWFAGSTNKPQNVWATRSGTESNLTYSIPTRDSDAITARLTSRKRNQILHLVPLGDLLALTSGAEWLINSGGAAGPITPGNIDYRTQGESGASHVRPEITNNSVLYAQNRGGRIREIEFSWESQSYKTSDLSLMAPHLFDGFTIVSMAFQRSPNPILWCVRNDGIMLGVTYVPEHEVFAWHEHETDGAFESVAVIPEGTEDAVYVIVRRTVGGQTRRFIERLRSRRFPSLADSFVVDSGLMYDGTPADVFSGFWHLIGKTVSILADGAVMPQQVVDSEGQITLEVEASKVVVGLPITADLQTLPLSAEVEAFGQATQKNINKVYARVHESSAFFAGPSFSKLREFKQRTTEPYGSPPALMSGVIQVNVDPQWGYDAPICIRQSAPLPLTVSSLVPDTALGG
jgi:hypothetical protein